MGDFNKLPSKKVLKDAFYGLSGGSETLTLEQFKSLCHKFYLSPTNKGIAQLFSELDKNNDDQLSFAEVVALIKKQWTPVSERKQAFLEDLRKVRHNSGPITKTELRTILQNGSDEALTDEDIDYCFNKMDINKDNQISEEELSELIFKMEDVLSRAPSRVGSHKREDGHKSQSRSRSSSKDSLKDKNSETRSRSSSKDSDSNSLKKHNKESGGNNHSQSSRRSESRSSNHEQSGNINDEITKAASPIHVDDSLKKVNDEEKPSASSGELTDDKGVSEEKHKSRSRSNSSPKNGANDEYHKSRSRSRSHSTDSKESDAAEKPRKGSVKSDHSSAGSHHEHNAHDIASNVGEKPRKGSGKSDHSSAGSHHEHNAHDIASNVGEKPRKGSGKSDHSSAGSHHEHNAQDNTNNINADEHSEITEKQSEENVDAAH